MFKAFPDELMAGDSVMFFARVFDPEHGRIRYKWFANGGAFSVSNDSMIIWYAPQIPGRYKILLRVNDAFNARDQKSINIKVLSITGSDTLIKPSKSLKITPPTRRPGGRQKG
jgi:hypothetical protein